MSYYRPRSSGQAASQAYQSNRVASRNPTELVVMLYERLLADLKGASIAIEAGDLEAKAERLQCATDVIFELLGTLNMAEGGEVAQRLAALYSYLISRIGEVSRTLDRPILDELEAVVSGLLSAWQSVATSAPSMATAEVEHR